MQFVSPDARNPADSVCERADGHAQRGSVLRVHHSFQALAALFSLSCLCSLLVKGEVQRRRQEGDGGQPVLGAAQHTGYAAC